MAGAEGLEVASQPLLRCPKAAYPLGARAAFDRCAIISSLHPPPAALGDDARHAPRASGRNFEITKNRPFRDGMFIR